jgi:hypothetical protein
MDWVEYLDIQNYFLAIAIFFIPSNYLCKE